MQANKFYFQIFILFTGVLLATCQQSGSRPKALTNEQKNQVLIQAAEFQVHTGDVILRCGRDFTSYRIREMSPHDKTFSHAGFAIVKNGQVSVYHLTPPELDEPATDTLIRLEPLQKFADPAHNFEIGIARFPLSDMQIQKLIQYLDSLRSSGTSFDFTFDLKTDNKMYCSEMIDKSLRHASNDSIRLERNAFHDSVLTSKVAGYLHANENVVRKRIYIPIENIYLNKDCKMIVQYRFAN